MNFGCGTPELDGPKTDLTSLRLAGISTLEDGNRFLESFRAEYNRRFAREPRSPHDAHRPLREDSPLRDIFRLQKERKVSASLTFRMQAARTLRERALLQAANS